MKVEISVEVDIKEILEETNKALLKMYDNHLYKDWIGTVTLATIEQNKQLLKIMKEEPY